MVKGRQDLQSIWVCHKQCRTGHIVEVAFASQAPGYGGPYHTYPQAHDLHLFTSNCYSLWYTYIPTCILTGHMRAARLDPCELRTVVPYTYTLSERSAELHGRRSGSTTVCHPTAFHKAVTAFFQLTALPICHFFRRTFSVGFNHALPAHTDA
ncbi:hypothetical protein EVAR_40121_1 [Eumeta japonica]|uniref:Uncharacterized protein n=1 Tax=Eumeta variegata TaxID=151549 RepID=A0A4C1WBP8_EUMVA|nr:hypothetical protein EVAR_40121_1 [Eumeta japonica]